MSKKYHENELCREKEMLEKEYQGSKAALLGKQGKHLKEERKKRGYTQDDISLIIDVDRRTYGEWERGKSQITPEALLLLSNKYEVSADYLLGRIEEKSYELKLIHEETRLSEKAIEKLILLRCYKSDFSSFPETVSKIIEHDKFKEFVFRLMQSQEQHTKVTKYHKEQKQQIEDAYLLLMNNGYSVLVIAGIIDDLFRFNEKGFIELRN